MDNVFNTPHCLNEEKRQQERERPSGYRDSVDAFCTPSPARETAETQKRTQRSVELILASSRFPSGWGNKLETHELLEEQYLFSFLILEDFFTAFVPSDLAFLPETHLTLSCQGTTL